MRHANPNHTTRSQAQEIIHQRVRIKGAPAEAVIRAALERLDQVPRVPARDDETHGGQADGPVCAGLAVYGDFSRLGGQVG